MKNVIRIDHETRSIVMDKTFTRQSSDPRSEEYTLLQATRRDYPGYHVKTRTIRRNPRKESYRGLTYAYMEQYIDAHENAEENRKVYEELRLAARCHSIRYPTIKKWFLDTYPELKEFGRERSKVISIVEETTEQEFQNVSNF